MLGRTVFSGYFSLAVIVLAMRVIVKSSGMQMLLGGLHAFYCVDPHKNPATQLRPEDLKSKKARARALVRQQLEIKGASEQIYRQTLGGRFLEALPLREEIDSLVTIGLSVVLNALYVLATAALLGWELTVVTVAVSLLLVVYTVIVLLRLELKAARRSWAEAGLGLTLVFAGSSLSLTLLHALPSFAWFNVRVAAAAPGGGPQRLPLHTFDVGLAARGFDALVGVMRERVAERLQQEMPPVPKTHPVYMSAAIAVWAGLIAMAMLGPSLQYSRMLYRALNVPTWGEQYMRRGTIAVKAMQLGVLLPVLVVVSQIPPLACYWGVPLKSLPVLGAALMLLAAATHLWAIPSLMQCYLDGGLLFWHVLLHNGVDWESKMEQVRKRLDSLRALLGSACAQVLAPPLIAATLGLLLLLHTGLPAQVASATLVHRQAALTKLPDNVARVLTSAMVLNGTAANLTSPLPPPPVAPPPPSPASSAAEEDDGLLGLTEDGSTVAPAKVKPAPAKEAGSGGAEEAAAAAGPGRVDDLWMALSHFLGWWTCLVWSVYTIGGLAVSRLGLNSG